MPDTGIKPQRTLTVALYKELTQEDDYYRSGEWRDDSLCTTYVSKGEVDGVKYTREDWFPQPVGQGKRRSLTVPEKVRRVCLDCPVRLECLTFAIQASVVDGIWAGHTFKTVAKIRRRMIRREG